MNIALMVAYEYPELDLLRRELAGHLELFHIRSVDRARRMLMDRSISVLVLDCIGDGEEECALLRWVAENRPEMQCIALVGGDQFCAVSQACPRNLKRLLRPAERDELCRHILRAAGKAEQTMLPVLFFLRRWQTECSGGSREDRWQALQALAARKLLRGREGYGLPRMTDLYLVLLYGPDFPEEETLRAVCEEVVSNAAHCFGCDVVCCFGVPCTAHEMENQTELLYKGNLDNVTDVRPVQSLAQVTQGKGGFSPPVLGSWITFFLDGDADGVCRSIGDYFRRAIAAHHMDRSFLLRFQQDFTQEVSFALKNVGIPAHELFPDTDELARIEQTVRYVPDMLGWVRDTVERAITLMGKERDGLSVSGRVCDYLQRKLVHPVQREELAKALHLSEGHIARQFRKEMGMSISEYQTEQRVRLACRIIQKTDMPFAQVAEQCGFRDYPYFYRSFKKCVGMSPSEYQIKMRESDM